ncbi:PH domain-containing protein [Rothia sp. ND6WE1A]|uniref:PH domain-containing protein n=1 Tax=Rothia sp. ND6WE1A TaxID=1848190 RepID=UPI00350FCF09
MPLTDQMNRKAQTKSLNNYEPFQHAESLNIDVHWEELPHNIHGLWTGTAIIIDPDEYQCVLKAYPNNLPYIANELGVTQRILHVLAQHHSRESKKMPTPTTNAILAWTLISEIQHPADLPQILTTNEHPIVSFKTFRDSATFTNKRLIVRDAQGLTGKKVEMYSLPYSSIHMWSSENSASSLDRDEELELWTKMGHIKIRIRKGLDVRKIDRLISENVLK